MAQIPAERTLDSSLALLREGYTFIGSRCRRLGSDVFTTRLLGRRAICAQGADAARMFYEPGRFTRNGALPLSVLKLLQDRGSVATLDGARHHHRKALFLDILGPHRAADFAARAEAELRRCLPDWEQAGALRLHDALRLVLCRAICAWAGLEVDAPTARRLTDELAAMIDNAGRVGPANWNARRLRRRTERFARAAVEATRRGDRRPPPDSALHAIATHRDPEGALLPPEVAAVELINVLRPTVAVARFLIFGALALHHHPAERARVAEGDDADLERFVQEVRRFYPFFPVVGGRARVPFVWRDIAFDRGAWVVLDLYGTNRDPRLWTDPESFRPDRFRDWDGSPFGLIPQGGGDHALNHRCPGEWVTIATMKSLLRLLVREVDYRVPEDQNLTIDLSRMPALPRSGLRIAEVRRRV